MIKRTITTFDEQPISRDSECCWREAKSNLDEPNNVGVCIKYSVGKNNFVVMVRKGNVDYTVGVYKNGKAENLRLNVKLDQAISFARSDMATLIFKSRQRKITFIR
jgi:hypothetical protein